MSRGASFHRVRTYRRSTDGKHTEVAVFRRGSDKVEIPVNRIDHIERLTTSPRKWLDSKIVVPTGRKDERGSPIFMVVRPRRINRSHSRSR